MRIPFHIIDIEAGLHWSTRCIIRVCLLLSLWNLPFPWLHHHALAPASAQTDWLPSHLDEFHASAFAPATTEQGWHLHFVYLGEEQTNDPLRKQFPAQHHFIIGELSQSLPGLTTVGLADLEQVATSGSLVETANLDLSIQPPFPPQAANGHFLKTAQGPSICDLISVSLC